ncbi:hypothetical protein BDV26DRAFT_294768 [Aspergillus bertholletiae]|uniref:Uncharacterized protein n=1 Tax=Aspergillus bertholletiae TaxID=1226010 RepID=A0A5N7B3N4_9EURO|nr:hypothetical protein BDV26DRAFT_294768 [Aspergillus bertholletiae]
MASENQGIEYTPTTHRISKAKKGKRVHACREPGCNKLEDRMQSSNGESGAQMQSTLPEKKERKAPGLRRDDLAFTDSGYGSYAGTNPAGEVQTIQEQLSNLTDILFPPGYEARNLSTMSDDDASSEDSSSDEHEICDSGQSVYSVGSVVPAAAKESYIGLLAADLAKKICHHLSDAEDLEMICSLLPRMLQEFALSFGGHRSAQPYRDIMVFVHRYRRYVGPPARKQLVIN